MTRPARLRYTTLVMTAERARKAADEGENWVALDLIGDLIREAASVDAELRGYLIPPDAPPPRKAGIGSLVCGFKWWDPEWNLERTCVLHPHPAGDWHRDEHGAVSHRVKGGKVEAWQTALVVCPVHGKGERFVTSTVQAAAERLHGPCLRLPSCQRWPVL